MAKANQPELLTERKPITVLHLHNSRTVGGIEVSLVGWARSIDSRRFAIRLFLFEEADGAERGFLEYLARRDMSAQILPWGKTKRLSAAVSQLVRAIRSSQPCIVHTHDLRPDLVGWLAARLTGCPLIASNHGWHSIWAGIGRQRRRNEALRSWLLRRFDLVVAVAESVRVESIRRGIEPRRVVTVNTGIDLAEFQPSKDREVVRQALGFGPADVVIGNVARLHPEKGQAVLLQAFERVSRQLPHSRLLIVGDGPLLESLRMQCGQLGISDRVTFLPFQDDIASLFSALDVFVLPSFAEGTPLVIYKAMAAGLAIVASRVAGIGELLSNGENALLLPPGDVPALADGLLRVSGEDPAYRHSIGQQAQQAARTNPRCSIEVSARRLESLYEELQAQRDESRRGS
jgi:glycosyltransferase involved in cell wall biosynthesis